MSNQAKTTSKRKYPSEQSFRLEGYYGLGNDATPVIPMLTYYDYEEYEEYIDVEWPNNYGRRRVQTQEWDDYILEAQLDWADHLETLEIDHKSYNKAYAEQYDAKGKEYRREYNRKRRASQEV